MSQLYSLSKVPFCSEPIITDGRTKFLTHLFQHFMLNDNCPKVSYDTIKLRTALLILAMHSIVAAHTSSKTASSLFQLAESRLGGAGSLARSFYLLFRRRPSRRTASSLRSSFRTCIKHPGAPSNNGFLPNAL